MPLAGGVGKMRGKDQEEDGTRFTDKPFFGHMLADLLDKVRNTHGVSDTASSRRDFRTPARSKFRQCTSFQNDSLTMNLLQ